MNPSAVLCERDYLGPYPLFQDKQFNVMFRLSRTRFERILNDIGRSSDPFFVGSLKQCSLESKILLALKTRAYGVAPHCFTDYFQMSAETARVCCIKNLTQ